MYGSVHRCPVACRPPHLWFFMNKRILLVDDSAPVRRLVKEFIENRPGLEVCGEAIDGVDGVEKARELRPDLIVLDLVMPRMNGLDAAAALQTIVPNSPIILFTFYKDVISSRIAQNVGITSVLAKTDLLHTLADEVQRLTA
jgi:DNA-binding NarL/FixJ family response regulator